MQFRSIGHISVDVIDARSWLQSIPNPIPTKGTRLEKILDVLLTLQGELRI